jgi:hypothetical protein
MISVDIRHLQRMLDCISAMRTGALSLVGGADNLLFLLDALEVAEPAWADEFTSYVATIESAGTASPEQIASMGSQFPAVVATTLDALAEMVRSRLPDKVPPKDEIIE